MEPLKIRPIWSNNRSGADGVSKIFNRYVVHNSILQNLAKCRSWIGSVRFSNNSPIFIKLYRNDSRPSTPC